MVMRCYADGCSVVARALGLCQKHYKRLKLHGDPNYAKGAHGHDVRLRGRSKWAGDCLEWQGHIQPNGYGVSGGQLAHRVAYEAAKGKIPPGMLVMHSCDNRKCVNPAHLSIGTANDNVQDCVSKQRHNRGEKVNTAVLTEDDVRQIRRIHRGTHGENTRVARLFSVSPRTICGIVAGASWKHVA